MDHIEFVGLSDAQVLESRRQHGENVMSPPPESSLLKQFFERMTGPFGHLIEGWEDGDSLIFILEIAALLSGFISLSSFEGWFGLTPQGYEVFFEPLGILVAIMLATGIAFYFELKADKEFSLLNQVNDDEPVKVFRNGHPVEVRKRDVVVGDLVIINTGDEIPADGTLRWSVSLQVDESTLTGEPVCAKTADESRLDPGATFPSNHVLRGTKVVEGHGVCEIFAVGDRTENGKVFEAAQIDDTVKTPLNEQLDRLSDLITKASYGCAALIIVGRLIAYLVGGGEVVMVDLLAYLLQTFMIAVTLIVVAVPEGLPMAVSLALAYSMRRMLKTNNLVRKMHSCETMGATTVICTDKTGTLTQNQMQVYRTNFYGLGRDQQLKGAADGMGDLIACGIAVNSTVELDEQEGGRPRVLGNPTEGALLLWLRKQGYDYKSLRVGSRSIAELPFSTERKLMATQFEDPSGQNLLCVKGAPEIVLSLCGEVSGNVPREEIARQLGGYQRQAMRTMGFAMKRLGKGETYDLEGLFSDRDLTFLGIAAISDPVREEVPAAIRECLDAGIKVKIVTGDTPETAKEIGRQIGLWEPSDGERNLITGPGLGALSDGELDERVLDLKIIARARPLDKRRLVESLQRQGQVVAVTGDGTNDAPALKVAHVGLSMGDGTSVAKEASDITIIDNSFGSIGRAVMWGRSLFLNIKRFILFQMTVNVAACLTVLFGAFMGTDSPLTVTQMLWVNLIMDTFAAMALASLPPSEQVMRAKPRDRNAFIIDRTMARVIVGVGGLFFAGLIGLVYVFEHSDITALSDLATVSLGAANGLSAYELSLIFTIFVMLQFFNMFNARAYETGASAFSLAGCRPFMLIACVIF
ncbi:MAG: calcium-translocating P-type ATPase, PMCA-type, partial [Succinivibrionaceae bacterium]|nr:calcium-translocating P-type ATPase, PMCA-type [Succinivibrionaceae bacterium]